MGLTKTFDMMRDAEREGYAVPALNFENMEMAKAIIEECSEMKSPVILQTTSSTLKYLPPEIAHAVVSCFASDAPVPVALHLDHGNSFELAKRCINAGYTSVMIDGSKLPFDENVRVSKDVCDYAKEFDIPVECELGVVGGKEDETENEKDKLTDPKQALKFVQKTGCTSLAPAVGTAHGFYKEKPEIDFDRISEINHLLDVLLVLHGTSGVGDEDVRRAVSLGIRKVNFATDLRVHFTKGVRKSLEDEKVYDPKVYLKEGQRELKKHVRHVIEVCSSAKRA